VFTGGWAHVGNYYQNEDGLDFLARDMAVWEYPNAAVALISPPRAQLIAKSGMSKADAKKFIWENATSTHNISDLQDILTDLMQNSKIQESSILAEYVQNTLVSGLRESQYQTRDLGVKQAPFYVLIGAEMPSVLAEISFISNPKDADQLRQERYLDEIADQIAAGVVGYVEHQARAALQL
jgi:N-acetylmuramoyl-L-alanine amidase